MHTRTHTHTYIHTNKRKQGYMPRTRTLRKKCHFCVFMKAGAGGLHPRLDSFTGVSLVTGEPANQVIGASVSKPPSR